MLGTTAERNVELIEDDLEMLGVDLGDQIIVVLQHLGKRHRGVYLLGVEGDLRSIGQERGLARFRPKVDVLLTRTGKGLHRNFGVDRDPVS